MTLEPLHGRNYSGLQYHTTSSLSHLHESYERVSSYNRQYTVNRVDVRYGNEPQASHDIDFKLEIL
jgi:hypothetical protein